MLITHFRAELHTQLTLYPDISISLLDIVMLVKRERRWKTVVTSAVVSRLPGSAGSTTFIPELPQPMFSLQHNLTCFTCYHQQVVDIIRYDEEMSHSCTRAHVVPLMSPWTLTVARARCYNKSDPVFQTSLVDFLEPDRRLRTHTQTHAQCSVHQGTSP